MSKLRHGVAALAATVIAMVAPPAALAALGDTELISRSGVFGPVGNADSSDASMSADGRMVAFSSGSTNLDPDDTDIAIDVFVRDREQSTLTLVSRAGGVAGPSADNTSTSPAISADGRYVLFDSNATNLSADDADTSADCYVRDLRQHTTTLVSRATGANGVKSDGQCLAAGVSADGSRVAFLASATNLDADDADTNLDLYVRDLRQNTTALVSRATGGAKANAGIGSPALSSDGRFVVFGTPATNLDPDDGDPTFDVFIRDIDQGTTELLSRATGAASVKGSGNSTRPAVSSDGRFVAFE